MGGQTSSFFHPKAFIFNPFLLSGRTQLPKVSSCLLFHHSYFWASAGTWPYIPLHSLPGALYLLHAIFSDVSMSSKNLGFPSNIALWHLLPGIGVSYSSFIGDVVVSFLERKCDMFPLLTSYLLWKIGCLRGVCVCVRVCVFVCSGYRLAGSNKGSDGGEGCPSITFSDLLEAEKWVWWPEGADD